jgi:hypothetical protein
MGHTVSSQRQVIESILQELMEYGKSLREDEKPAFESALAKIKKHMGNISFACSYNTWALVLFSIIVEMERERLEMKR